MFIATQVEIRHYNHHGEPINADFAVWIIDFTARFSETFWITIFAIGFIIILIAATSILYLARRK